VENSTSSLYQKYANKLIRVLDFVMWTSFPTLIKFYGTFNFLLKKALYKHVNFLFHQLKMLSDVTICIVLLAKKKEKNTIFVILEKIEMLEGTEL